MARNNIKILTDEQLTILTNKYRFALDEQTSKILVRTAGYSKVTCHLSTEPFSINAKSLKRKVCFSLNAIEIWKNLKNRYSLFQIQDSVNRLTLMYQNINEETVLAQIKNKEK